MKTPRPSDEELDRRIAEIAERQMDELGIPSDPVEYDKWFRAKVQESLDRTGRLTPHEEVMARMDRVISRAAGRKNRGA